MQWYNTYILLLRDDNNDARLKTFTVRSEDKTVDILGPLVLPISRLYDLFNYWRVKLKFWTGYGRNTHKLEVAKIQAILSTKKLHRPVMYTSACF